MSLLNDPSPSDYAAVYARVLQLDQLFRQELASQLEPALNVAMQKMPHAELKDKQTISRWANAQLRPLSLATRCPKTGMPSILIAGPASHSAGGRFRFRVTLPDGQPKITSNSQQLPEIELVPDVSRREPLAEHWAEIARNKKRGLDRDR